MACEIRWKSSLSATCLHAASCLRLGIAATDAELAALVDPASEALLVEIINANWPIDEVLGQLASLSADYENNRELVTRALARRQLPVNELLVGRVAGRIADLEAALRRARPEIVEELAVRGKPLREQWEARGPGMLQEMARLSDAAVVPEFAEVVLVAPYASGHGVAHATQNRVTFEAVLANPHAELPETVRLAWLLSQLNSDLPRFADVIPAGRAARSFQLAMLAPALAAGEAVELAPCDEPHMAAALELWRIADGDLPADAASRLWQWWETWLDGPEKWEIAVAALDGVMAAEE